jgi:ribosomal subunit interface protein
MEHSQAIEDHVRKQLKRIDTFLASEHDPIMIDVVLESHETHHHHSIEIRIKSPHYSIKFNKEGHDMYVIIDEAIGKTYDDLCKAKEKVVEKRQTGLNTHTFPKTTNNNEEETE